MQLLKILVFKINKRIKYLTTYGKCLDAFPASWGKDKLDVCVTLTISRDTENQLKIVILVMPVMVTKTN